MRICIHVQLYNLTFTSLSWLPYHRDPQIPRITFGMDTSSSRTERIPPIRPSSFDHDGNP